jgi:hypothetical protein
MHCSFAFDIENMEVVGFSGKSNSFGVYILPSPSRQWHGKADP